MILQALLAALNMGAPASEVHPQPSTNSSRHLRKNKRRESVKSSLWFHRTHRTLKVWTMFTALENIDTTMTMEPADITLCNKQGFWPDGYRHDPTDNQDQRHQGSKIRSIQDPRPEASRIQDQKHPRPEASKTRDIQDQIHPGSEASRIRSIQDQRHPGSEASKTRGIQDQSHPGSKTRGIRDQTNGVKTKWSGERSLKKSNKPKDIQPREPRVFHSSGKIREHSWHWKLNIPDQKIQNVTITTAIYIYIHGAYI